MSVTTTFLPRLEREGFEQVAAKGVTVAVYRTALLDGLVPVAALAALRREGEACFLLESATGSDKEPRFSFVGASPSPTILDRNGNIFFDPQSARRGHEGDILHAVRRHCQQANAVRTPGLPRFAGGFVGLLGWDLLRGFSGRKRRRMDIDQAAPDGLPDAIFHRFDDLVAFDHVRGTVVLICNVQCTTRPVDAWKLAQSRLDHMEERLARGAEAGLARPGPVSRQNELKPLKAALSFDEKIAAVKREIEAGSVYHASISRGFEIETDASALSVYRALRAVAPTPYLFYLESGGAAIYGAPLGSVCRVDQGVVHVKPFAGARARPGAPAANRAAELELLEDERARAEHVALTDVARNDVGQVSRIGRVAVHELMAIERHSQTMQLASHVTGELDSGFDGLDALKTCSPSGAIVGAPKAQAVALVDELEGSELGVFGGTIGYVDLAAIPGRNHASTGIDACVAARTFVQRGRRILSRVQANITVDSDPRVELDRTEKEAQLLLSMVRLAEEGLRP